MASVSFEGTGAWSTWATKTFTITMTAGNNTIRLNPTNSGGLVNIDYIDLTSDGTPPPPPPPAGTLYVATNGTDGAAGTVSGPTTLTSALTRIAAGGTIFMRGGTYRYSETITIAQDNNGTASARKKLYAPYP